VENHSGWLHSEHTPAPAARLSARAQVSSQFGNMPEPRVPPRHLPHRHTSRASCSTRGAAFGILDTARMETDPLPSIVAAIARGRGRRGRKDPATWVRVRAQLLSALALGHPLVWLEGCGTYPLMR
jgi:hypothetical protein